ncbi:hypothetical protein [Rubrobacter indicoceani]|uniref:hypothetical protein n=1 Tax=Rubrobacter indicoceani TaxID=2051957 RepID=UPI000E5A9FC1|nr:hypothetical protein [Rubrobacter indicoceani]
MEEQDTKGKILKVLQAIPNGVLYSTSDWQRILGRDKREIKTALDELASEGRIEVVRSDEGRPDKPLYRLGD